MNSRIKKYFFAIITVIAIFLLNIFSSVAVTSMNTKSLGVLSKNKEFVLGGDSCRN